MYLIKKNILKFKSFIFFKIFFKEYHLCKKICLLNNGLALNICQIGIRFNFFIIEKKNFYFFLNSSNYWVSKEKYITKEGCLSLKKSYWKLRGKYIIILSYNLNNVRKKIFFSRLFSVCLLHETDHVINFLISKTE
ncbi:peptide deformylase [Candidatus Vidania fulgoroideorum]